MKALRKLLYDLGVWRPKDLDGVASPPSRDDMEFCYRAMAR